MYFRQLAIIVAIWRYHFAEALFPKNQFAMGTRQHQYEQRRDLLKKHSNAPALRAEQTQTSGAGLGGIDSGADFRRAFELDVPMEPEIRGEMPRDSAASIGFDVSVDQIIEHWTLNSEQARAFRIVAEHSLQKRPDQLRMFLSGPGGTGKSRVIDALTDFFNSRGEGRRIRLSAFTGVAARNIRGMTLHSALSLSQFTAVQKSAQSRGKRDLIAMWQGVDYLIIDEVSMLGCALLHDINAALCEAKENTNLFGGINIIFAGDFAQLPPVAETKLYACVGGKSFRRATKKTEKAMLGKLLWLSVQTVVILSEQRRQSGPENNRFVALLDRLRRGSCTIEDYELLQTRLITECNPNWSDPELSVAAVLVSQNAVKDKLNEMGARAFAARSGQELHWYYAADSRNGKSIDDMDLLNHLRELPTSNTNQRLGKMPLVIGMPVMITHNFDVGNGIVNGSRGTLTEIRYTIDSDGNRHATSCVVHIPDMTGPPLDGLEVKHAAVLEEKVKMIFTHPHSLKKCTIERTQLPLVPAFAMTAHKAQGQTMNKVVLDLEGCRGTEAPYVMLSRAKSLDGVHILRPFKFDRISSRPSEESRIEFKRLEILRLQTIVKHGTGPESSAAQGRLTSLDLPTEPCTGLDNRILEYGNRELEQLEIGFAVQVARIDDSDASGSGHRRKRFRNTSTQEDASMTGPGRRKRHHLHEDK